MENASKLRLAEHVKVKHEKCGTVVFEAVSERIYIANETATKIISMLREGKDLKDIITSLSREYNVDEEAIAGDVYQFVEELEARGIIRKQGCVS